MGHSLIKRKFLFTLCVFILLSQFLKANDTIILKGKVHLISASEYLTIYEDTTNSLTLNEILTMNFKSSKNQVPNLGISKNTYWVKIKIKNISEQENFLISLALPTLDMVQFFYKNDSNAFASITTGEKFPFHNRKYNDPDYIFNIHVPKLTFQEFYFKIASNEGIQLPITIGTEAAVFDQIKKRDILTGIYLGIMLAMILYNLFIYYSLKDTSYIYYVVYILLILFTQTILQGYPFQYLWPNYPMFAQNSLFIFPSLVSIAGLLFMRNFLRLEVFSKKLLTITYLLFIPYALSICLAFTGNYKESFLIMEIASMLVSIHMIISSVVVFKKGYRPAIYFLYSWIIFLIGIIIYILKDFEILPFNNFTRYTMQIGSGFETILLSFALAARINIYKKEKEESQAETLKTLKENEKIITEQNALLESKVKERTSELEASNKSLKETQAQLISVEKMASLGQLTAGISHEINNPINFVLSNIKPLKRDVNDIFQLLEKYSQIKDVTNLDQKINEINLLKKELDIDYLTEEINLLLKGIDEGAYRTSEIVKGLKNFSRTDEADLKMANIHEGIDSTLSILNSEITNEKIAIVKNYGDVVNIECFPGKLNQVFMNLLSNAIHAVSSKKTTEQKTIAITTIFNSDAVLISIGDNGIGIPEKNISKLFDPFFTTKDVGMGTGLGLSIVYGIIKSHQGDIKVETDGGKGTKFTITLPFLNKP